MKTRTRICGLLLAFWATVALAAGNESNEAGGNPAHTRKTDVYGMTALHRAVEADDKKEAERLIHLGADVNVMNRYHVAPLSIAVIHGDTDLVHTLLKAGADPNVLMGEGEPVIMTSARLGHTDVVSALIAAGADVNVRERLYGQTAVMWAAIENHGDVIKILVEHHADVNARANVLEGEPLWRNGKDRRTGPSGEALQLFGTGFSKGGLTALMYAVRQGALEATNVLMDLKADASITDPDGLTPLLIAIMNGQYDAATALIEKGADVNQADKSGEAPLYAAVDERTLFWVLNRATPRAQTKLNALQLAELLLAHGARVDTRLADAVHRPLAPYGGSAVATKGTTPFVRAAIASDLPMMRLLLAKGADPKATTGAGVNALEVAAGLGWRDNDMQTFVAQGFATEEDSIEAIRMLINLGLDVNAQDDQGRTAMHGAASRGANQVIQFLADHGAKIGVRSKSVDRGVDVSQGAASAIPGRTPFEEAMIADPPRLSTATLLRKLMGMDPKAPLPRAGASE